MSGQAFNCTRTVTARKPHQCQECGRQIAAGEDYKRTAAVWEGDFFTCLACLHCAAARVVVAHHDHYYHETYYHGLGPWLDEVGNEAVWSLRLLAGFRAHWRFQSGALMPLPQTPVTAGAGSNAA